VSTIAAHGSAAEIDLETEFVTIPENADPAELVSVSVSYTNNSADDSDNAKLRLILPSGVFLDWSSTDIEAVETSISDNLGNFGQVELDEVSCDNMLVSMEGQGGSPPSIQAGTSGQFSVDIPLPEQMPTVGVFVVDTPESVAGTYDFALGRCHNGCGDLASCFGGPLSQMAPVESDLELVNDPNPDQGEDSSMGCNPLEGFTAGNIAIVRRGGCQFGTKALNAETAGAAGVVIVNSQPAQNIHSISIGGGDDGDQVTIPVILVSYENGEALITELAAKAQVNATLGAIETEDLLFASTAFHATTDTDPDGLNDCDHALMNVDYILNEPPEAAFSWAPPIPVMGQEIQFTDTSSNAPTSWSWDFDDDIGASTDQNPTYTFTEAGNHSVTLTAGNEFGEDSVTQTVNVSAIIPGGHVYFVPAAAYGAGAEESFWVTDVDVVNSGDTTMTFQFAWLPRDQNNLVPQFSVAFMLAPDHSARYENVLGELFGLGEEAFGGIGLLADSGDAQLMSRTYNQPPGKTTGTFGQGIPGIAAADMTPAGVRQRIMFMTEDDDFRSNLGCQNGANKKIRIMLELFAPDGSSLETRTMDLDPWSNNQVSRIFSNYSPIEAGFVDVWTNTPDGSFYCYGSVGDRTTSDPTTVLAQ
jgi:PKD repeat protein